MERKEAKRDRSAEKLTKDESEKVMRVVTETIREKAKYYLSDTESIVTTVLENLFKAGLEKVSERPKQTEEST